jgi:hypothetical protein
MAWHMKPVDYVGNNTFVKKCNVPCCYSHCLPIHMLICHIVASSESQSVLTVDY